MDAKLKEMKHSLKNLKKELVEEYARYGGESAIDEENRPDDIICIEADIEYLEDDIYEYKKELARERRVKKKNASGGLFLFGYGDGTFSHRIK